jgi:2-polyprenyl-3-methyl-5-hydroxy-6-metoxy-1,4-benzoquinol methylase
MQLWPINGDQHNEGKLNLNRFLYWLSQRRLALTLVALLPEGIRLRLWAIAYDMYDSPTEQFYGSIYLEHIKRAIQLNYGNQKLRILSIGCGHGRDSIPLAKLGHQVLAVDKSKEALKRAEEHARREGVSVEFELMDIFSTKLSKVYDVILAIETFPGTLYETERLIQVATKFLKTGGLLAIAVYTRYYQIASHLKRGDYATAETIANGSSQTKWLHPTDLKKRLISHGYNVLELAGIATISGPRTDSFGDLPVPEQLGEDQRKHLLQIELNLSSVNEISGCARRMLALARKEP